MISAYQALDEFLPNPSAPASDDRRGFEWYYLWRQYYQELATLKGHTNGVSSVAFAPDGRTLASGSLDHIVTLSEVATGKELATLKGHMAAVSSVAFAPDDRTLATGSHDHTVKLWEVATGKELATLKGHTDGVWSVAFAPDGRTLALRSPLGMGIRPSSTR